MSCELCAILLGILCTGVNMLKHVDILTENFSENKSIGIQLIAKFRWNEQMSLLTEQSDHRL